MNNTIKLKYAVNFARPQKYQSIIFLVLILIFGIITISNAQKIEISGNINANFTNFSGSIVRENTFLLVNTITDGGYANNPFGSKMDMGYGLSANLKYLTSGNFVVGSDLGYELLRSKNNVNKVYLDQGILTSNLSATGISILNQGFINLYPFVGYRLNLTQVSIDFLLGVDLALRTSSIEKSIAKVDGNISYSLENEERVENNFDFRTRVQVGINYQRFSLFSSYAKGLSNYTKDYVGGPTRTAKTNVVRIGLGYKIK